MAECALPDRRSVLVGSVALFASLHGISVESSSEHFGVYHS
jgi:hypothetical protein